MRVQSARAKVALSLSICDLLLCGVETLLLVAPVLSAHLTLIGPDPDPDPACRYPDSDSDSLFRLSAGGELVLELARAQPPGIVCRCEVMACSSIT